ncbi:5-formyltetrahydrofolate cyclo-ligase [Kiloniella antarctica]|uniref:5-formyltetrahydrofolate cyclo-ligase n=1 Tax=Kiloniella antarctica TaxID=1550907 RepID=A0ABW5BN16_9PROT
MKDWEEIKRWRKLKRAELRSKRLELSLAARTSNRQIVSDLLREGFPELTDACICFCWPFDGEINFLDLIRESIAAGATAALPVVVEKNQPLEFWAWQPGMKMARGIWNIPVPEERIQVKPTIALVPLVGYDDAGYRLGYGGGYFDRTLAAMNELPLTIGVGYALGHLETIHPQPHDIPLDAIVTEAGCTVLRNRGRVLKDQPVTSTDTYFDQGDDPVTYSSSPCYMHEADPRYFGYMNSTELIELLKQLLDVERAGVQSVAKIAKSADNELNNEVIAKISKDMNSICEMLSRHIADLGGPFRSKNDVLYEKKATQNCAEEYLELFKRGQDWSIRKLREALPKIGAEALARDLRDMLNINEKIIQKCVKL